MPKNPTVSEIVEKFKPIWALNHASSLLDWDVETYMPVDAAKSRGVARAQLALMKQRLITDAKDLLSKADGQKDLDEFERGIVRVVKRDLDYYSKVPPDLLEELQRITSEATVVWREAKKKSDFSRFKSYLERIVELKRREAEALGYVGHPYNALLDRFEEGLMVTDVDNVFSKLASDLKRILEKTLTGGKYADHHPLESVSYSEDAMRRVNDSIFKLLGMPEKTSRLDVSAHPFTQTMSIGDVRVTTKYTEKDFKEAMFSLIHECGHAFYELQVHPSLEYTPLAGGVSSAIHESQSRFWENSVGRSREFVKLVYPILKENLPFVAEYDQEEIYRYFNVVRRSLIRIYADELTYNFHIILRYELEKKLISGEVSVSDIPEIWNDAMEKYVGVRPKSDAEGVLQDIHWSGGAFGYFPTYAIGNVITGMVYHHVQETLNLRDLVAKGQLNEIKAWLREKIHKWGATYSPQELQRKSFGETYNPQHLIEYLESKFLA